MAMDSQKFRFEVERYTKEIIEDLEEVKKINDIEQQWKKVEFDTRKHKSNFEVLKQGKPEDVHYCDNHWPFNLDNYEKKIKELDDYSGEVAKKSNQERKNFEDKENNISPKKQKQYTCDECGITERGKYKYNKSKKDNQKFCSSDCFYKHYAERCDGCLEKCVISYKDKATGFSKTYYQDVENKTGTLCSKCHQEQLKDAAEEKRKDKEWEENCKKLDKNMDDLVDGMVEAVGDKNEDNSKENNSNVDDKSNQIKSNQIKSNQIKSNQIKSNLRHFQSNSISSVELTEGGDLKINYSSGKSPITLKFSEISNSPFQKIKTEMEKDKIKKLTKEDLKRRLKKIEKGGERNQKSPKNNHLGLKIGLGILVGVGLIGLVIVLIKRRKTKNKH